MFITDGASLTANVIGISGTAGGPQSDVTPFVIKSSQDCSTNTLFQATPTGQLSSAFSGQPDNPLRYAGVDNLVPSVSEQHDLARQGPSDFLKQFLASTGGKGSGWTR